MENQMEELFAGFVGYWQEKGYTPATRASYGQNVRRFLEWLEEKGVEDVRQVGRKELEAYADDLTRTMHYKAGTPLTARTQAVLIRSVKRFFEWLEVKGEVLMNPAHFLKEPKVGNHLPKRILTEAEVERLMKAPEVRSLSGLRDRTILEAFYSTGMRVGEMASLKVGDVDFREGVVRVREAKGWKARTVPLGDEAARYLRRYLEAVRPKYLMGRRATEALWIAKDGHSFDRQCLEMVVKRRAKQAGLGTVFPHVLRHTFATHLVRNGAQIQAVAGMLGHTRLQTTQIYTRVAGVDVKKAQETAHPRERDEEVVPPPMIRRKRSMNV